MAAERAAGLVMDWEETCREERRGLTEKIQRIEAARAGVLRALGVAEGGEELLAGEVQRAVGLFARTRTLTTLTLYTLGTLGLVRAHAHTHNAWTSARMHPRSLASPSVSRSLARSLAPTLPPSPPPSLRPSVPFSQEPSFLPPCLPLPRCLSLSHTPTRPRAPLPPLSLTSPPPSLRPRRCLPLAIMCALALLLSLSTQERQAPDGWNTKYPSAQADSEVITALERDGELQAGQVPRSVCLFVPRMHACSLFSLHSFTLSLSRSLSFILSLSLSLSLSHTHTHSLALSLSLSLSLSFSLFLSLSQTHRHAHK